MAKAKKQQVDYKHAVYYYATSSATLDPDDEIYPETTEEKAINYLREREESVEEIFMFEIKCTGKYKVKVTLEKVD